MFYYTGRLILTNQRIILIPSSVPPWPKRLLPWLRPQVIEQDAIGGVSTGSRWVGLFGHLWPGKVLIVKLKDGKAFSINVANKDSWERDITALGSQQESA